VGSKFLKWDEIPTPRAIFPRNLLIIINPTPYQATLPCATAAAAAATNRGVIVTYIGGKSSVLQQGKFSLYENPPDLLVNSIAQITFDLLR
jgi:hypothetical protein